MNEAQEPIGVWCFFMSELGDLLGELVLAEPRPTYKLLYLEVSKSLAAGLMRPGGMPPQSLIANNGQNNPIYRYRPPIATFLDEFMPQQKSEPMREGNQPVAMYELDVHMQVSPGNRAMAMAHGVPLFSPLSYRTGCTYE